MKINEVSRKFNISLSKLRYYEKVGLFDNVKRVNNIREYEDNDIKRLQLILSLKSSGLSIKEILVFIELEEDGHKKAQQKTIFINHRNKLVNQIHKLQKNLDSLDYLIYRMDNKSRCV